MNQSKIVSLADIITLSTALVYGFICFLGINFYTLGDIGQSALYGFGVSFILGLTAYLAKFFKLSKKNFQASFIAEIFFILAFTVLMFGVSYYVFPHFFVVTNQKNEIQKKLNASIAQGEEMFKSYELYAEDRKSSFNQRLKGLATSERLNPRLYDSIFGVGVDHQVVIESKLENLRFELFPTNYVNTKKDAQEWFLNAEKAARIWKPIGIVNVVNEVDKNSQAWLRQLIDISTKREPAEVYDKDFAVSRLQFEDIKVHFTSLGSPTPLSIGLSILAYVLMLFSWWKTYRDSRTTGASQTEDYEVVL